MNLRQWRKKRNLSMAQAAVLLGVSQPTISRIERGAQYPDPITIKKFADRSDGQIRAGDLHRAWEAASQAGAA